MLGVLLVALVNVIDAAPDAPCMDAARVERVRAAVDGPGVRLALRRTASGALGVALSAKGRPSLEREVPADAGACDAVERVVVSLVRAWLSSPVVTVRVDAGIVAARVDAGPDTDAGVARFGTGASEDLGSGAGAAASGGVVIAAREKGTDAGVKAPLPTGGVAIAAGEKLSDAGMNAPLLTRGVAIAAGEKLTDAGVNAPLATTTRGVAIAAGEKLSDAGVNAPLATTTRGVAIAAGEKLSDAGVNAPLATTTREKTSDAGANPPLAKGGVGTRPRELASDADGDPPLATEGVATTASENFTDGGGARGAIAIDMASSTRSDAGVSANEATASADAGASSRARSSWTFGAGLFGGIASGSTSDVLPQGLLSLDATWRWVGIALDVGLSGALSRQVAPGSVSASWQWLSLSARAAWPVTRRLLLDVQVGARAHRVSASAAGFSQVAPPQALLSVGGVASVGASFTIVGPVGVSLRGSGALRPPERFVITDLGPVLDLGAFEGAVFAGVVTRW